LISEIVGPTGSVRTIEVQADLAQAASEALVRSGHGHVVVATGDALVSEVVGDQKFDRIIATCSVSDLSPAWTDVLAPDGTVVVPLRLRAGIQASVALVPQRDKSLTGISCVACGFMPLRSESPVRI
jgi:protein-L-isoaspartate(D-aspartate) O-methyltransferase